MKPGPPGRPFDSSLKDYLEWNFTNPAKSLVYARDGPIMLAEYVKEKGAKSVARHAPEFAEGAAPPQLKLSTSCYKVSVDGGGRRVLALCKDNAHIGLAWSVGFNAAKKEVHPTGVVVYVKKQAVVPKDGEVRLS